ncbi:Hypothetical predicted protein, partial [Scomber scombrus]
CYWFTSQTPGDEGRGGRGWQSLKSSFLSVKSDRSNDYPPNFSNEPGPSDT